MVDPGRAVGAPNSIGGGPERPIPGWVAQHRGAVQATLDLVCWISALVAAVLQRHDFDAQAVRWTELGLYLALLVGVAIPVATVAGLYRSRWQFGSYEEVAALACVAGSVGVSAGFVNRFVINRWVPVGASITAPVFALVLMFAARYLWRGWIDRKLRPEPSKAQRIIVFGAGEAGRQAVVSMMRNPCSRYLPVALLDDDANKRGQRIKNLSVVGTRADLSEVARQMNASAVLIAIPSAGAVMVRELVRLARAAQIETRVLPSLDELPTGEVTESDIRVVSEADLLGRRHIQTDVAAIAGYLTGKRVLVTGAGGSIGSELCRQLSRLGLNRLVMLDRDESGLHAVQLSIEGRALLDTADLVVADIRDRDRLDEVFREYQPQVVFHAAALKHLTLLERYPHEAVKTNVLATTHLLEYSTAYGVERFVNISTDKAADPISILGYTKRIAERLTSTWAGISGRPFVSVRFGNVLGSRGSVVPAFRDMISNGRPVTVTHPDVTRFFMTIQEACQLVIQAGAIGQPGEVLILDMGEPVRITELARQLIDASGRTDIDIIYTGLRRGEKLHEELIGEGERDVRPGHPLIMQNPVPPLTVEAVRSALADSTPTTLSRLSSWVQPAPGRDRAFQTLSA